MEIKNEIQQFSFKQIKISLFCLQNEEKIVKSATKYGWKQRVYYINNFPQQAAFNTFRQLTFNNSLHSFANKQCTTSITFHNKQLLIPFDK